MPDHPMKGNTMPDNTTPKENAMIDSIAIEENTMTEEQTTMTEQGDTQPEGAEQAEESSSNREAAKYRRRLRDTEAERDQLSQRVEAMQRAEVDRIVTEAKLEPKALWASGAELANLLTEDGLVDTGKVSEAITAARTELGIPAPRRNYVPREGANPRPTTSGRDQMINVVMGG